MASALSAPSQAHEFPAVPELNFDCGLADPLIATFRTLPALRARPVEDKNQSSGERPFLRHAPAMKQPLGPGTNPRAELSQELRAVVPAAGIRPSGRGSHEDRHRPDMGGVRAARIRPSPSTVSKLSAIVAMPGGSERSAEDVSLAATARAGREDPDYPGKARGRPREARPCAPAPPIPKEAPRRSSILLRIRVHPRIGKARGRR